jgi:predicted phosphodiesterase
MEYYLYIRTMKQYRPRLTQKEYEIIQQHRTNNGVGIIGDTHEPFCHPDYRDFCYEVFDRFGVSDIVHIGDEVDNAALSYHEKLTDMPNAESEAEQAQKAMEKWYATFPDVKVCVGNHSALPFRQATTAGIPKRFLKSYEEIWKAPKGWKWELNWEIDNVIYEHGTGSSGARAAVNRATANRQSTVIGHCHSFGGVNYMASRNDLIFGMNVGCGIDVDAMAFSYGKNFPKKPTLGCGVVLDGGKTALFIPMDLGSKIIHKNTL